MASRAVNRRALLNNDNENRRSNSETVRLLYLRSHDRAVVAQRLTFLSPLLNERLTYCLFSSLSSFFLLLVDSSD